MAFDNEKQLIEAVKTMEDADRTRLGELEAREVVAANYYHGKQWRRITRRSTYDPSAGIARLDVNYDVNSRGLRVSNNRVAQHVQKAAAATFPERIEAICTPRPRDERPDAVHRAQLMEDMLADAIESAGLIGVRRDTNFLRSVMGSYGAGLRVRSAKKSLKLYGSELDLADSEVLAYHFGAHQLVLDPFLNERDLCRHETIILREVWSAKKMREWLGALLKKEELDESLMQKIGELALFETSMAAVSDNELYPYFRTMSETKGARIRQVHERDENGRFRMFIVVDIPGRGTNDGMRVLNWDNPESPFGGDGLPLFWYHGHRRVDGPTGIGEAEQLKDDQDHRNIAATWLFRQGLAACGYKIIADRRSLGSNTDPEKFEQEWNNQVGGVVWFDSGHSDNPGHPPALLNVPAPDSYLMNLMNYYEETMPLQIHRVDAHYGKTKSHVADATVQTSIELGDQVLGTRTVEDIETDVRLLKVLGGTYVKLVKRMSPCTLKRLERCGFSDTDLATLFESDPRDLGVDISIPAGSVRYRSPNAKRAELNDAAEKERISPSQWREAMARDLDQPVTQDDKFYQRRAEEAALMVASGEEWTPLPLGEYASWFIAAFTRAMVSRYVAPDARARLMRAVEAQQAQMLAAAQAATAAVTPPTEGEALASADQDAVSFERLVDQLSAQAA